MEKHKSYGTIMPQMEIVTSQGLKESPYDVTYVLSF